MTTVLKQGETFTRTPKGDIEVSNRSNQLSAKQRHFLLLIDKKDSFNRSLCQKLASTIDLEQLISLGLLSTAEKVETTLYTANQPQVVPNEKDYERLYERSAKSTVKVSEKKSSVVAQLVETPLFTDCKKQSNQVIPQLNESTAILFKEIPVNDCDGVALFKEPYTENNDFDFATFKDGDKVFNEKKRETPLLAQKESEGYFEKLRNKRIKAQKFTTNTPKPIQADQLTATQEKVLFSYSEMVEIKTLMITALKQTSGLVASDLILTIDKSNDIEQLKRLTGQWRAALLGSSIQLEQIHHWFDEVNAKLYY